MDRNTLDFLEQLLRHDALVIDGGVVVLSFDFALSNQPLQVYKSRGRRQSPLLLLELLRDVVQQAVRYPQPCHLRLTLHAAAQGMRWGIQDDREARNGGYWWERRAENRTRCRLNVIYCHSSWCGIILKFLHGVHVNGTFESTLS